MTSQRGTSDVKRYPGSLHDPRYDILGLLFLVTYLLVILLVQDWDIRSLFIALFVFHGLALLLARIRKPYVECDSSGVRIRFLFAPPISIPYRDIGNAAFAATALQIQRSNCSTGTKVLAHGVNLANREVDYQKIPLIGRVKLPGAEFPLGAVLSETSMYVASSQLLNCGTGAEGAGAGGKE